MEVWSGAIDSGSTTPLTGIRLIDPNSTSQSGSFKNAKLSLRAYVNPDRIPIVCFTGPSLELHSSDRKTIDWIRHKLLRTYQAEEEEYEELSSVQQCPVGILIRVDEQSPSTNINITTRERECSSRHAISDILIFGTLSAPSSQQAENRLHNEEPILELKVYAIPLCSDILTKAQSLSTPPFNPEYNAAGALENEPSGEFLPDFFRSPSPKRKRVATLFEAAAEYHKKVRRKGAAAMSEFITREKSATPQFPQFPSSVKIKRENENSPGLSGNFGDISLARRRATSIVRDARAGSRRSSISRPGSSMSQALSTSSRKDLPSSRGGDSTHPPERRQKPRSPNSGLLEEITANNKALLTRTILTCMRLYGFRRANTRTTSTLPPSMSAVRDPSSLPICDDAVSKHEPNEAASECHTQDTSSHANIRQLGSLGKRETPHPVDVFDGRESVRVEAEGEDDMEFKDMYHATYRASAYALRRFFKPSAPTVKLPGDASCTSDVPTLGKDKAMDTVDSVLKLFCEMSDAE
ncbi:hypothetical protein FQN49_006296 [Arthroderma sp. PD_2]|nr:hypothetical protein FQN49_006296 [Arthroderma sp. PD_2]